MQQKIQHYFRTYRRSHGLKQKQMAILLGKSRSFVSQLETGYRPPNLETVICYQILFGARTAELIPELYQSLHLLLARRVEKHPYLVSDKRSLSAIKSRLKVGAITDTNNKKDYAT